MSLCEEKTVPAQAVQVFRQRCQTFLIEAVTQTSKRFPFDNEVFQNLKVLDPLTVKSKSVTSLAPLLTSFPSLVTDQTIQDIDTEWRLLRNSDMLRCDDDLPPTQFWVKVRDMKRGDNELIYPHLSALMLNNLLCLPHSSATVERVFSSITRMKTKLRNRLSSKTMSGILHTKRLLSNDNCHDFEILTSMRKRMNNEMYMKNSQDKTTAASSDVEAED